MSVESIAPSSALTTASAASPCRPRSVLSHELIQACGDRAAGYDRENRFFTEDFEELRSAGYLNVLTPRDLVDMGLTASVRGL